MIYLLLGHIIIELLDGGFRETATRAMHSDEDRQK